MALIAISFGSQSNWSWSCNQDPFSGANFIRNGDFKGAPLGNSPSKESSTAEVGQCAPLRFYQNPLVLRNCFTTDKNRGRVVSDGMNVALLTTAEGRPGKIKQNIKKAKDTRLRAINN